MSSSTREKSAKNFCTSPFVTSNGKSRGIQNRKEIQNILEKNNGERQVLLCINGHDHGCDVKQINGIYYYTLNSASYIWQNVKEIYSYGEDVHKNYPYLKNMILYKVSDKYRNNQPYKRASVGGGPLVPSVALRGRQAEKCLTSIATLGP